MKESTPPSAWRLAFAGLLAAALHPLNAHAAPTKPGPAAVTIFVGENTTGAGNGTETNPFREFSAALTAANPGDTIVILGAYSRMVPTDVNKNNLTIEGRARQMKDGSMQPSDVQCNVVRPDAQHCFRLNVFWDSPPVLEGITIRNLTLTGGKRAPIVIGRTVRAITIENNKLQHAANIVPSSETGYGLFLLADRADKSPPRRIAEKVQIIRNEFPQPTMNTAIYVNNVDDLTIAHNTVVGVRQGDGIVANYVNGATIEENSVSNLELKIFNSDDPCKVDKLATGIKVRESHGVVLRRNTVWNSTGAGIMVRVDGSTNVSTGIDVLENIVHHTVNYNEPSVRPVGCPTNGGWPSAVTLSRITGGRVLDNHVFENWGEGIALNTAKNIDAQRNRSHDNFSVNFYLNNASEINVQRNYVWNTSLAAHYRDGKPAKGMGLANESIAGQPPNFIALRNITIANNMVRGGQHAIGHYTRQGSNEYHFSGMQNVRIFNNTFFGSYTDAMIAMVKGPEVAGENSVPHENIHVNANIFYQPNSAPLRHIPEEVQKQVQFMSNIWYRVPSNCLPALCEGTPDLPLMDPPNDRRAHPALVSDGGTSAEMLKLLPGSPAIDAAAFSFPEREAAGLDYFGTVRPESRKDVGAHEFIPARR